MSRPAVFLDRDGTMVEERGYIDRPELLEIFPWTGDALRLLLRAGFAAVVVTNQSAVGRGIVDEPSLGRIHRELDDRLRRAGAAVEGYYYCPHHVDASIERYRQACRCRKPLPGLIERACRDLDLDPAVSFMVGDRWSDVACGDAAGCRTLLVRSGHGTYEVAHRPEGARADAIVGNLMEAVSWILGGSSRR